MNVSIVLATYNGEKFLSNQLASLSNQTLLPAELIVRDDGSTDDTISMLQEFARSAPFPVRIFINERNLGAFGNFIELCRDSNTDYIAFCDQDDVWYPRKLEVCVDALVKGDFLLIGHSVDLIDDRGHKIGSWKQGMTYRGITFRRDNPWSNFLGMSIVIDKRLVSLADPELRFQLISPHLQREVSHDQWFDFLGESVGRMTAIDVPLAAYRLHKTNVSGVNKEFAGKLVQMKVDAGFSAVPDRQLPLVARERALLLDQIATHSSVASHQDVIAASSKKWKTLSEIEGRRLAFYSLPNFFDRFKAFAKLTFHGAYRGWSRGGLSPMLLIKDALLGLLQRRSGPSN